MKWIEANPLPDVCLLCEARAAATTGEQEDCWECDHAGERWFLSKEDELKTRKKLLQKAVERYQRQIAEIDTELMELEAQKNE